MTQLTDQERKFMRHALGLNRRKQAYRNRFVASQEQVVMWRDLVARGLAHEHSDIAGMPMFCVRLAGVAAVLLEGESLDDEERDHVIRLEGYLKDPDGIGVAA